MGRADSPGCKSHLPICWGAGVVIGHLITLASIVAQRGSSATAAYHRSIVFSQVTSAKSYPELIWRVFKKKIQGVKLEFPECEPDSASVF